MMEHPELDSMQDYDDKCYEEENMNSISSETADKILADVMKSDELVTKTLWPSQVKTHHINMRELKQILNSLVEQSEEEKCPICDTYKIEICGCDNHLIEGETDEEITKRKIYDYVSENVTDYKNEPVILGDVIDWLDKESE